MLTTKLKPNKTTKTQLNKKQRAVLSSEDGAAAARLAKRLVTIATDLKAPAVMCAFFLRCFAFVLAPSALACPVSDHHHQTQQNNPTNNKTNDYKQRAARVVPPARAGRRRRRIVPAHGLLRAAVVGAAHQSGARALGGGGLGRERRQCWQWLC
jgi:hypothetical protein